MDSRKSEHKAKERLPLDRTNAMSDGILAIVIPFFYIWHHTVDAYLQKEIQTSDE